MKSSESNPEVDRRLVSIQPVTAGDGCFRFRENGKVLVELFESRSLKSPPLLTQIGDPSSKFFRGS
ncbi:MAG: hypothetical protein HOP33_19645 [Verrucomicrobia bacterium]|nr:hypothetical protein [Verrucomicrobiota bacterium]